MFQPSNRQIEEASQYIQSRVEAEQSMRNNLYALLLRATQMISQIAEEYLMSVSEAVESKNTIIQQKINRVIEWVIFNLTDFTETLAVADHEEEKEQILEYIHRENHGDTFSERMRTYVNEYFLSGKPSKALNRMLLLTTYAVSEGWMHKLRIDAVKHGAEGFYSMRGSSYPCSECDAQTGYHPMEEYRGLWHPNCKCIIIFDNPKYY